MPSDLNEYFESFQNSIRAAAAADETYTAQAFVEEVAKRFTDYEEIDELVPSHFEGVGHHGKKLQFDGYEFGGEDGTIVLAISDYRSGDVLETLTMSEARRQFDVLEAFLASCLDGTLESGLEESSDGYQVASEIVARKATTRKARLYLLTNTQVRGRLKSFEQSTIGEIVVEFHVWDIDRFERIETSQLGREEIDIDLTEWAPTGVPALRSVSEVTGLQTYLAVLPGRVLSAIYGKYGGRVLEANVRSFLTARGNVNRGIRGTIQQQPDMFLAYNNGIAATASSVTVTESQGTVSITSVRDLQIVNGGQTTASLFYVERNDRADLSEVAVQMKLIVVNEQDSTELVPRISRYANTQNRVSEADFFSNHPFHVRMEEMSRRLLTPVKPGAHFQTKWFYERTRGQYLNEKARLATAQARRFDNEYPKPQLITKTDAAKFIVSWDQKPHTVSSGAQKNFLAFANQVSEAWSRDETQFGEAYFQKLIGLGILFNSVRAVVQKSSWYSTGYLANIVTYTLAKLASMIDGQAPGSALDFSSIWKAQAISSDLLTELESIAEAVFYVLTDKDRPVVNVTEWAKREKCWDAVKSLVLPMGSGVSAHLIDAETAAKVALDSKKTQRIDSGIGAQITVMGRGQTYWAKLRGFGQDMNVLSEKDLSILKCAIGESVKLPTELQSGFLLQLEQRMKSIGFVGN